MSQSSRKIATALAHPYCFTMNLKATMAVALLLFAACGSGDAKAMSIDDFANMTDDDEATYVTLLVDASAQLLKTGGQPDQARKAVDLFHDTGKNGGVSQLAANLKMMNNLNLRNASSTHSRGPAYQVEDAVALTLKDAGIIVPANALLKAGKDFSPSGPRQHNTGP